MRVFSNTTPIIALASIGRLDLLPKLFDRIHVVEEVIGECAAGGLIAVPPLRELDWIVTAVAPVQTAPLVLFELDNLQPTTCI